MELNFLCPHHEHRIFRDNRWAYDQWHGLTIQGKYELKNTLWARGASFFGAATEIALLRAAAEQGPRQLDWLNMSLYSNQWLIAALCKQDDIPMAKDYLKSYIINVRKLIHRKPVVANNLLAQENTERRIDQHFAECEKTIHQAISEKRNLSVSSNIHLLPTNEQAFRQRDTPKRTHHLH